MDQSLKKITRCEVCGNTQLIPVLNLGAHPMCDDLVPGGDQRTCKEYPIEILFCDTCRTAHQQYQVPKAELFPRTYHYRSRFTADVLNGMKGLVDACEKRMGSLADRRVLDIGCNDGSLLGFFRDKGAVTVGVEPTDASADARRADHTVYNEFLSEAVASKIAAKVGKPDIIVFTNVFAHIENLDEVIRSLRCLMSERTMIVIENHYLGAILDGNQFDTFYHEHPRTYSYTSFVHIARSLDVGISEVEFPSRYGGNIRVFLGPRSGAVEPESADTMHRQASRKEEDFLDRFSVMRSNIERWRKKKGQFIAELVRQNGPIRAKAFPGRAAILVKLLGLDERSLLAVHEKPGSMKIGHYVPGTRIPILSDDALFQADKSAPLLNLAWHIGGEIRSYLANHGYGGQVFDIIGPDDFGA